MPTIQFIVSLENQNPGAGGEIQHRLPLKNNNFESVLTDTPCVH